MPNLTHCSLYTLHTGPDSLSLWSSAGVDKLDRWVKYTMQAFCNIVNGLCQKSSSHFALNCKEMRQSQAGHIR